MSVLARDPSTLRPDRYILQRTILSWELTPLRIATVYLLFGFSALYFSDVLLVQRLSDPLLGQVQALKGGVEVVVTAGLIFGLTKVKQAQVNLRSEKIDQQREELLVLHRVLRHNLRNDANVFLGISESLKSEADSDDVRRKCEILLNTAEKMAHYTEQASRIRRVSGTNGHTVEMNLGENVPDLIRNLRQGNENLEIEFEENGPSAVRVNHMFAEAIEELLGNAIQHNDRETPQLEVAIDRSAGPVHFTELRISDNGPGIPERVVSILEESEADQLMHLQGMGLWFVYWVVTASDGHIVIEENESGGTTICIRVPSAKITPTAHIGTTLAAD